jgi:hypothetical protein
VDGRVQTPLLPVESRRDPLAAAKWAAAPLRWDDVPAQERRLAARVRSGYLAGRHRPSSPQPASSGLLGHLRVETADGWVALYRATHPVTGDHFVTRFELEAADLGYRVDGLLGYASALGATRGRGPETIHWASRAGRGRRYEDLLPELEQPHGALPAPTDEEDEFAVGPVAPLQPRSAAGLATLGVRPGGRVVHQAGGEEVGRAVAITASGADAALSAIGFEDVLARAAEAGWDVVVDASGAGLEELVDELRGSYAEVYGLAPDAMLSGPDADPFADGDDAIRSFADITPYRRRRGAMLRALASS